LQSVAAAKPVGPTEFTINWNALKVFLLVAHGKDLKEAARALQLSHSTAFRQLRALEGELETRLFERQGGVYALTDAGNALLEHARPIEGAVDHIKRAVAGRDQKLSGQVRVTAPTSFAHDFLPEYLHDFGKIHPGVSVELLVSNDELNLSSRQADVAIRVASRPAEHLVGRQVRSIPWGVYGRQGTSHSQWPTNLDQLAAHRLIGASGTLATHRAFVWLEHRCRESIVMRSDDPIAMARLAEAGVGLAILPHDSATSQLLHLFPFEPGGANRLWVLTHPDLERVRRIQALRTYLSDRLARESRLGPL
jgi:DNA-binding transcriptional LysR family regulator